MPAAGDFHTELQEVKEDPEGRDVHLVLVTSEDIAVLEGYLTVMEKVEVASPVVLILGEPQQRVSTRRR